MRSCRKILTGLMVFSMMFGMASRDSRAAAAEEPYTYTVTLYAGNQGGFTGTGEIQVTAGGALASGVTMELRSDGSAVTVSGLKSGYRISVPGIQEGVVSLKEDSRYYVRGLRKSGYDNDTVAEPSFDVTEDQDYVVAYGIRGEMVAYTVRYQDTSGKRLAADRTYYGNVGDRPVAAFLYIEGYQPRAYNVTRTLSRNEAENIFTFVYNRISTGGGSTGTGGGGGGGTAPAPEGTGAPEAPAGTGAVTAPGGAGAAGGAGGAGAAVPGGGAGGVPAQPEDGVQVPDDEVPADEGPREVENQDEEVPKINVPDIEETARAGWMFGLPVFALLALLLAAAALTAAGLRYRTVKKKKAGKDGEK